MDNFHSHFRYVRVKCHRKTMNRYVRLSFHEWYGLLLKLIEYIRLFVYRLKPRLSRMYVWCNKLRNIHLVMLIACIYFFLRLPLMNEYSNKLMESLSSDNVGSSMVYHLFEQASTSKYLNNSLEKKNIYKSRYKTNFQIESFIKSRTKSQN